MACLCMREKRRMLVRVFAILLRCYKPALFSTRFRNRRSNSIFHRILYRNVKQPEKNHPCDIFRVFAFCSIGNFRTKCHCRCVGQYGSRNCSVRTKIKEISEYQMRHDERTAHRAYSIGVRRCHNAKPGKIDQRIEKIAQ